MAADLEARQGAVPAAPVICLMGPTAAGKTDLALNLARQSPLQIVSVDSAQVYRGMDIGTGKPDPSIRAEIPHRLIDIRDPAESYSAQEFLEDALREIDAIHAAGKLPLLVGGTMLYFKVLRDGLASMPAADVEVRQEIESLASSRGWSAVHDWLQQVDPESAARIHANDPQRLQRALEVFLVSGRTMTELHRAEDSGDGQGLPFSLHFFAIQPPDRSVLHKTIASRFHGMLRQGLVDEVRELYRRDDLHEHLPSIKSVGYRQVWQYLDGVMGYDAMVERGIIATRQLAKRQLTWLRSWDQVTNLTDPSPQSAAKVLKFLDSISM